MDTKPNKSLDCQEVQVNGVEGDGPEQSILDAFNNMVLNERTLSFLTPEERKYYLINKDTGEVIDMRNEQVVRKITDVTEAVHLKNKDTWTQFWQQTQMRNDELVKACQFGNLERVQQLLANRDNSKNYININSKQNHRMNEFTPLHFACYEGNLKLVKLLLTNGAKVNETSNYNHTPLHIACLKNKQEIVSELISKGADLNKQDNELNTCLHISTLQAFPELVKLLLDHQADPMIKNHQNKYPYELTTNKKLLKLFEEHGCQVYVRRDSLFQSIKKFLHPKDENQSSQFQFQAKCSTLEISSDQKSKIGPNSFLYFEQLGKGSFGEVYLVQSKDNGRYFAMKTMKKEKMMKQSLIKYAKAEKSALSIMDHPFIVKLNYAFQTETQLILVMDYCPGGNLSELLDVKGKLPENIAKVYVAEILLALEALHQNCIIFRDLKPENVVLDEEGHAMLTDFGLSKLGVCEGQKTDSFCGSPAYMAPEIIKRRGHSRQVDWYLLGVLTYELLVGVPPYFSENRSTLFENIQHGVLKIPRFLSSQAVSFIVSLLDRNPTTRLGSKRDAEEIRQHAWLKDIDWHLCCEKQLRTLCNVNRKLTVIKPDIRPLPGRSYEYERLQKNMEDEPSKQLEEQIMEGWSYKQPDL